MIEIKCCFFTMNEACYSLLEKAYDISFVKLSNVQCFDAMLYWCTVHLYDFLFNVLYIPPLY